MDAMKRHERAFAAVHAEARTFFASNPDRSFHIQDSRPFALEAWGAEDHKHFTRLMAFRSRIDDTINYFGVASKGEVPDTDAFLFQVWSRTLDEKEQGKKSLDIDPFEHLGMLVLYNGNAA